jgi:two-component system, NarL family, response regulator DesR
VASDGTPLPVRTHGERPDQAVIRVLLAEDMHMVRGALVLLLDLEPDLEVVAEAGDGKSAVDLAIRHRPDVALVDLDMPILDGIQVTAELANALPSCAVVILTGIGRPSHIKRALESGARGFLLKDTEAAALPEVIRKVHKGNKYVDPQLAADALIAPPCPLSPKQLEVLRLAKDDATTTTIARHAHLSPGTTRNYLAAAVARLGVKTRAEAIRMAQANGWF